ncbi:FAD-dependent monooxygenase [Citricoccus parietis]|uniref:FAD-dependent monooxygenase n=2 Tax=Citricoccus parietis TaxID=592307 RepID=A0ABV6F0L4_9MICC
MTDSISVPSPRVLIAGGGPVGMFLAADLGRRNIPTLVVERSAKGSDQAKVMQISVRTLEFARQLGMAESMWNWGFPLDYPLDNVFLTSLDGYELGRAPGAPMGQPGSPGFTEFSPEFQTHCPQPWLEPIIEDRARSFDSVTVLRRHEFGAFDVSADGVRANVTDLETGREITVDADYLIGCEGFGGSVQVALGIPVEERTVDYSVDLEFLAHDLFAEHDKGPAVRYTLVDEGGTWGTIVAVDGTRRWRLSVYAVDRDQADHLDPHAAIRRAIGHDLEYEIIRQGRWKRRAAMAASFGGGRVFLAGDSAHCSPPNGGFGMNTGIADVINLSWKLEASLQGWAGPQLLETYSSERRPIAQLTLAESVRDYHRLVDDTASTAIRTDSPEGAEQRRMIGERLVQDSLKAWRPLGIHIGYGYPWSSIVCNEPGVYPTFDPQDYTPTTSAGFRAPHWWIEEGRSTLDLFGRSHVLLRIGDAPNAEGIISAAAASGMPLEVVDLSEKQAGPYYDVPLVLVRPDGYIAWSGSSEPRDPGRTIDTLRGAVFNATAKALALTEATL